jgi:hypothetical protein
MAKKTEKKEAPKKAAKEQEQPAKGPNNKKMKKAY